MASITPAKSHSRPMATWIPEPATQPPAGFTLPLSAAELALLADFRALPAHERQLIGDIAAALVPDRPICKCACGWYGQRHEVVMSLPLKGYRQWRHAPGAATTWSRGDGSIKILEFVP